MSVCKHCDWKNNVDIGGLPEVRTPDIGHSVTKGFDEEASYHLHHSGVVDNTERYGLTIALGEATQAALLVWVSITSQLTGWAVDLITVAVYAPTLCAAEDAKDSFYDDLHDVVDRVSA